jgi:hypothetical protein
MDRVEEPLSQLQWQAILGSGSTTSFRSFGVLESALSAAAPAIPARR